MILLMGYYRRRLFAAHDDDVIVIFLLLSYRHTLSPTICLPPIPSLSQIDKRSWLVLVRVGQKRNVVVVLPLTLDARCLLLLCIIVVDDEEWRRRRKGELTGAKETGPPQRESCIIDLIGGG